MTEDIIKEIPIRPKITIADLIYSGDRVFGIFTFSNCKANFEETKEIEFRSKIIKFKEVYEKNFEGYGLVKGKFRLIKIGNILYSREYIDRIKKILQNLLGKKKEVKYFVSEDDKEFPILLITLNDYGALLAPYEEV